MFFLTAVFVSMLKKQISVEAATGVVNTAAVTKGSRISGGLQPPLKRSFSPQLLQAASRAGPL